MTDTESARPNAPQTGGLIKDHPALGKTFTEKSTGLEHRVDAVEKQLNFGGARGGRQDAYHLTRLSDNTGSICPEKRFVAEFEEKVD